MLLRMLKSKIHRGTVTDSNLNYEGSVTIDIELLEKAGISPYEMVQVYNIANGSRIETYTISGKRGSGIICMNGAAARLFSPGDSIIIVAYALLTPDECKTHTPKIILVDKNNHPVS